MELSFVQMSVFGTVATNNNHPLASIWQEYGKADARWLHSDSCIVAMEVITVFGAGLLCVLLLYLMANKSPSRHFFQIILCTGELYGGWMTFAPEWLTGSKNLNTSNPLYLFVYLIIANGVWVVIPALLLYQSYLAVSITQKKKN